MRLPGWTRTTMFAAGPPYVSRRTFGFNVRDPKLEAFIPTEPKEMANTK